MILCIIFNSKYLSNKFQYQIQICLKFAFFMKGFLNSDLVVSLICKYNFESSQTGVYKAIHIAALINIYWIFIFYKDIIKCSINLCI